MFKMFACKLLAHRKWVVIHASISRAQFRISEYSEFPNRFEFSNHCSTYLLRSCSEFSCQWRANVTRGLHVPHVSRTRFSFPNYRTYVHYTTSWYYFTRSEKTIFTSSHTHDKSSVSGSFLMKVQSTFGHHFVLQLVVTPIFELQIILFISKTGKAVRSGWLIALVHTNCPSLM